MNFYKTFSFQESTKTLLIDFENVLYSLHLFGWNDFAVKTEIKATHFSNSYQQKLFQQHQAQN